MIPVFSDCEGAIHRKKNVLINSYVKQYGDDYQSFMEKKFEEIDWCVFENPRRIQEYIDAKSVQLGKNLTFQVLKKLKLPTDSLQLNSDHKLVSADPTIQHILDAFFPGAGYICDENINQGIFCFAQSFDDAESLDKKAIVLKELNIIQDLDEMNQFVQTNQYEEVSSTIKALLKDALAVKKDLERSFTTLREYSKFLSERENAIVHSEDLKYINECKRFILDNYPSLPIKQFNQIKFFRAPTDLENPKELPLAPGLLEYFLPDYTEKLQTSASKEEKDMICAKRWEYLNSIGIYQGDFNFSDDVFYKKDWYTIPKLSDYLPDMKMVQSLRELRKSRQDICMDTLIQSYIINDFELPKRGIDDSLKEMFFFGSKHPVDSCNSYLGNSKKIPVFICPMDANYASVDFTIDRQVRQVMETFVQLIVMENQVPFLEKGTVLEEVKNGISVSFYDSDQMIGKCNSHINEIHAQKLSIESTLERYENGDYLLVPPDEAKLENTSYYDQFISNFDLVFPKEFQKEMLQSRMYPVAHFMPLYNFLNQNTLSMIDQNIMSNSAESKTILQKIGAQIENSYCSNIYFDIEKEVQPEQIEGFHAKIA